MRVAIIGGGPAGCAAAYFLRKKGITDITFYERTTVGGCAYTKFYDNIPKVGDNIGIPLVADHLADHTRPIKMMPPQLASKPIPITYREFADYPVGKPYNF